MFYIDHIREIFKERFKNKIAYSYVKTFGCQQNEADSEKICGFLKDIGFAFTNDPIIADFILFNTCAVRHTAQYRIYGHIGNLKKLKKINKNIFIVICGCMVELEEDKNEIMSKFPYIDFICGAKSINEFPELLYQNLTGERVKKDYSMNAVQKNKFKSWVPIISGCNNFCSYCIVPFVRGREISRNFDDIINECKNYILNGTKIITFLGQNVNSYNFNGIKFQDLLKEVDKIDGDFVIRFMTSHPKDFTNELVDVLCECKHFSKQLHLPVQSGNNRILKLMNRKYTREDYIEKIKYAREKIDDLVITSDIIVGFPSETEEEFEDTISLVKEVKFFSLFNFIYSPRKGTCAANMNDFIPYKEKSERMTRLIKIQDEISEDLYSKLIGKTYRSFVEEIFEDFFVCRTESNLILKIPKKINNHMIGDTIYAKIVNAGRNVLYGECLGGKFEG